MSKCSEFFAMCQEAGGTFVDLCGDTSSDGGDGLPPMRMWLHVGIEGTLAVYFIIICG